MYHRFHDRFGTAGVVIGVIALIVALGGSAFAKGLFTKPQEKQIAKIAKKEAQKYANSNPGAPGTNGTNGTNGTPGEKGAKGDTGTPGKSVTVTAIPTEETECGGNGGAMVEEESTPPGTEVCNGSPWTAGGTLPEGSTETGTFSPPTAAELVPGVVIPGDMSSSEPPYLLPISFSIPLSTAPTFVAVPSSGASFGTATGCAGVVGGIPKAASGKFCLYFAGDGTGEGITSATATVIPPDTSLAFPANAGASRSGAILQVKCPSGICTAAGLWAVTG